MNEQIKELAREAGFYANPDVEKFEKFAELIIRRCAEYCGHDPSGVAAMLEDFGLKETRW